MRRLLLASLMMIAIPMTAEAGRIHPSSMGGSDDTSLGFQRGRGSHGLGVTFGHIFPPGPVFEGPPGPPPGVPAIPTFQGFGHFRRFFHGPVSNPAAVPEPGTALLLAGGLLGLAWRGRARR